MRRSWTLTMVLAALAWPCAVAGQSWTSPRTWIAAEVVTAGQMNTHVRDNLIVLRAGGITVTSQAIGDLLCAPSTTAFARLADVATGQVVTSGGVGVCPSYSATPGLTSVDIATTVLYGNRAITVDTGGVLNIVLASAAGDDFTVDTTKLVVEGDSGNVGIGTASPGRLLTVSSTGEANIGVFSDSDANSADTDALVIFGVDGGPTNKVLVGYDQGDDTAVWTYSGVTGMRMDSGGDAFLNDTANAQSTMGLTINQLGNDNNIFTCKDTTDVAHGMTTVMETDTYCFIFKQSATLGGLGIGGMSEGTEGVRLVSYVTSVDTNKDGTATAAVILNSALKTGTTITDMSADANLVVIENNSVAVFLVDEDGDVWRAGSSAMSNATEGGTGRIVTTSTHDVVTLTGASTDTTTISIPSGAIIHGCSMNVNTAVVDDGGDDTWSAAFITGSSATLATGAAAAQDTKVDAMDANNNATATTQVRFTPNGGSFTSGAVEIVCYYTSLTSLGDV